MNWQILFDYHYGGYAKKNQALSRFIEQFQRDYSIPLEHVYTGKLMSGVLDLIYKGFFPRGTTILAIHTGGFHYHA
jgi:1-aminocyclopropane-1-carboxylate deaminase